jgi:hypothetical protein
VAAGAVRERMGALRDLMAEKSQGFRTSFLGRTLSAVSIGGDGDDGSGSGTATKQAVTDNFLKLTLDSPVEANCLIAARVTGLTEEGLAGNLVSA